MQYLYIHEYFYHLQEDYIPHPWNIASQNYQFLDNFSLFHGWVPILESSKAKVYPIFTPSESLDIIPWMVCMDNTCTYNTSYHGTISNVWVTVFEGVILYFLYSLSLYNNKIRAIEDALFRLNQPNLTMLGISILIFSLIIYLKDMRMEIPVKSKREPLLRGTYPIKLFYSEPRVLILQVSLQIFHI
jgi:hypothetical protein